jgi:hypothetical protein
MRCGFRDRFNVLAVLACVIASSSIGVAQAPGGAVDCSKPLPAVPNDWMKSSATISGVTSVIEVTVEGNRIKVRQNAGAIWNSYAFDAKDIKAVEEGGIEDGVMGLEIHVAPFEFENSRGEKTPPAGVTTVHMDMNTDVAEQAAAGFRLLQQRAVCAK